MQRLFIKTPRGFIQIKLDKALKKRVRNLRYNVKETFKSAEEEILNDSEKKDIKRNASHRTTSPWQSAWRTC